MVILELSFMPSELIEVPGGQGTPSGANCVPHPVPDPAAGPLHLQACMGGGVGRWRCLEPRPPGKSDHHVFRSGARRARELGDWLYRL